MANHHHYKDSVTSPIYTLGEDRARIMTVAFIVGVACLAGAFFLSVPSGGAKRFSFAYLTNFCFFMSIALGAVFFVMSQHLTKAGWSVTIRRIAEMVGALVIPMMILFIPIAVLVFMGFDFPFKWNGAAWLNDVAADLKPIHEKKSAFLNKWFFLARNAVYFAIWISIALFLLRNSLRQDTTKAKGLTARMQALCAPLMIPFIAALVFASFDWEMSLAPMWFSTMFPVYFFAGAVLSALATITLISLLLQRSGRVTDEITVEHYHDMGKLMFAFIVFWGYIAFSQFMLIWYANIPEETFWYNTRFLNPGWKNISIALLIFHLLIPFLGIMARTVRRSKPFLLFACLYMLAIHWLDHFWLVMPQFNPQAYEVVHDGQTMLAAQFTFPFVELLTCGGFAGLFVAGFCIIAGNRPLVPLGDPRLVESLNFENV